VAAHRQAGSPTFTITTEFGPDPYMPALPFTRQPVTSQWDVNVFMMELLAETVRGNLSVRGCGVRDKAYARHSRFGL
jgi:hypothetical protein